ncbi:MAG: hypothetical protein JW809_02330 [Pirellulales bacterium]|nr:hypothetical protein [Pirellulales bacterium]
MNAIWDRLPQGTFGKILVAVVAVALILGAAGALYVWPLRGWFGGDEQAASTDPVAGAKAAQLRKMNEPAHHPTKAPSARSQAAARRDLAQSSAEDGPQQGEGEPRHVYRIAPFAQPSVILAFAAAECAEKDARATAVQLSTRLVHEADQFTLWLVDDEALLDSWTGTAEISPEDRLHGLWRVTTSRRDDGTFAVDAVENLRQAP